MLKKGYVYKIENKLDGKIYIGSTKNFYRRVICHLSRLRKNSHGNPHLQSAWNLYGKDAFSFSVIEELSDITREQLVDIEQQYFDKTNCCDRAIGYNVHPDAACREMSEETKRKIGAKAKDRIAKYGHPRTGAVITEEHKRKQSLAMTGRKHTLEHNKKISDGSTTKKKVIQISLDGVYLKTFDSIASAAMEIGCSRAAISICCSGKITQCKGFKWRYSDN